jgi:hypothetical protein
VVTEGLQRAGFEGRNFGRSEPFVNQLVAISDVLGTGEAEEMIDDATAGCGDLDLVGIGTHPHMPSDRILAYQ